MKRFDQRFPAFPGHLPEAGGISRVGAEQEVTEPLTGYDAFDGTVIPVIHIFLSGNGIHPVKDRSQETEESRRIPMKRFAAALLALLLLSGVFLVSSGAEDEDEDFGTEYNKDGFVDDLWPGEPVEGWAQEAAAAAGSDPGTAAIIPLVPGNRADYARIGEWTVNRGFWEGSYMITLWPPDESGRIMLGDENPGGFIPLRDGIVHYSNEDGWMVSRPDEAAAAGIDSIFDYYEWEENRFFWQDTLLPLGKTDTVFYADGEYLYFYAKAQSGRQKLYRADHDGQEEVLLGSLSGTVLGMQKDGKVLLLDTGKKHLRLWDEGVETVLYSAKDRISLAFSALGSAWVQHKGWFGPVETDGGVRFRQNGSIISRAVSSDRLALLVLPEAKAEFFDVLLFSGPSRAYTLVGRIARSEKAVVELQSSRVVVWGTEESLYFEIPAPQEWLPY